MTTAGFMQQRYQVRVLTVFWGGALTAISSVAELHWQTF
jgi:hypothetical protein